MMHERDKVSKNVIDTIKDLTKNGDKNIVLHLGNDLEEKHGESVADAIVDGILTIYGGLNQVKNDTRGSK